MKTITKYIVITVLLFTVFSCHNDDEVNALPDPIQEQPEAEVRLTGIEPQSGPKEAVVTFTGENFGTDLNRVQVFFNDKEASVQTINNTQITAIVPPKAFSGRVKVIVGETELIGSEFTYEITDIRVSTLAGSTEGFVNGSKVNAKFKYPQDIVVDVDGNLYITDGGNYRIRKITPSGIVSTLAGGTFGDKDGIGENAKFGNPYGIAIDEDSHLYITDSSEEKIRKIAPNGVVTTLAGSMQGDLDGPAENARFSSPRGIAIGADGSVYLIDSKNNKLRKVTPKGEVSSMAGRNRGDSNGTGANASFDHPRGVTIDSDGTIYICDTKNHKIRKITPSGVVSTIAGNVLGNIDGPRELAAFNNPGSLTIDEEGIIYVADTGNNRIRRITPDGMVSTIAGSDSGDADGVGVEAKFNNPIGILIDNERTLYVVDNLNHRIRKITQE